MTVDHLREAGVLIAHLQRALLDGTRDLAQVPATIKRIIADQMWRERTDPLSGRMYGPFTSFGQFVVTSRDEGGLGSTVRQLLGLCESDPEARLAIDTAVGHSQGERTDLNFFDNIQEVAAPTGTSEAAALRRLRKDRPDLLQQVLDGDLKANTAMIEAGFRHRTFTVRADDPVSAAKTLRKHMSAEDVGKLIRLLLEGER